MLKVTKPSENRVDIDLQGTLDSDAMRDALDTLIEVSEGVKDGIMFYRVTQFSMPTLGAIMVEVRRLPKLFCMVGRFRKCAVLSDKNWIRKAGELEGLLIPGLEIKSFELNQADAAEDWLAQPKAA